MSDKIIVLENNETDFDYSEKKEKDIDLTLLFEVNKCILTYKEVLEGEYDITEYVSIVDPIYKRDGLQLPFNYTDEFLRVKPIVRYSVQEFDEILERAIRERKDTQEISNLLNRLSDQNLAISLMLEGISDKEVYVDESHHDLYPTINPETGEITYEYVLTHMFELVSREDMNYVFLVTNGKTFIGDMKERYHIINKDFKDIPLKIKRKKNRRNGKSLPFDRINIYYGLPVIDDGVYHYSPYADFFRKEMDCVRNDDYTVIRHFPIVRYLMNPKRKRVDIHLNVVGNHGESLISILSQEMDNNQDMVSLIASLPNRNFSSFEIKMEVMMQLIEQYVLVYDLELNEDKIFYKRRNDGKWSFIQRLDLLMLGYNRWFNPMVLITNDLLSETMRVFSVEHFRLMLMRYYSRIGDNMLMGPGTIFKYKDKFILYLGPNMSVREFIVEIHENQIVPPRDLEDYLLELLE